MITVFLVLVVGGSIGWYSHSSMKVILDDSASFASQRIKKELTLVLKAENNQAISVVSLLSHHIALQKNTVKERMASVPALVETLDKIPSILALYIGDSAGNFFLVRKLDGEQDHKRFSAPENCLYVLEVVHDKVSIHTLFDEDLHKISAHRDIQREHYDPRVRPWYEMALESNDVIRTPIYDFYAIKKKGYTLSRRIQTDDIKKNKRTTVFGADIKLDYLTKELELLKPSPNSKISLVDDNGNLIAGDTIDKTRFIRRLPNKNKTSEDKDAYYSIDEISRVSDTSYYLVLNIPKTDIFLKSETLYRAQAVIILVLLVLGVFISLFFSEKLSDEIAFLSKKIANVKAFNFSKFIIFKSHISEIEQLSEDIDSVSDSINAFNTLIYHITSAKTTDQMVTSALKDILFFTQIPTAILFTNKNGKFVPFKGFSDKKELSTEELEPLTFISEFVLTEKALDLNLTYSKDISSENNHFDELKKFGKEMLIVPLSDRENENNGVLLFLSQHQFRFHKKKFIKDLSPYLSLSLESKFNTDRQKELFDALIHIIANAIDAKNPTTARHCIRVPDLTARLAHATCNKKDGKFASFDLSDDEWEMLYMSSWLHDCGKITTPEFVIDKATKLETIYNRIHEIRMRFELLKRETELEYWKTLATDPENAETDYTKLQNRLNTISEDFYFIARCNLSGTPLTDEDLSRIDAIASQTWTATLDDSIGLSLDELKRRKNKAGDFPHKEHLLADKDEHKIARPHSISYPEKLGIKLQASPYLYNRGELTNLKIRKGTLTNEERFKINEHVIQSLLMLSSLPFPKHLSQIPNWASSHHERMDGKGYPRNLHKEDMHPVARMIAIADVYEALTAHDRPYKTHKTHQEAIRIMTDMVEEGHLDPDLFEIFIHDCNITDIK